jgi:23S rRNA (uracil1939-C5)-methyltransferase
MYMATAGGPSEYRNFKAVTHLHGKEWITETIDDLNFRIYPQSFFQPNPGAAAQLYRMILAEAHLTGRESVLGLYSGTGCIELYLARHAASVEGVDSLPENVAVARANALDNGLSNCIFHGGPAETIFGNLKETFYGRIVVDPPRAGLAAEAIDGICRLGPPMVLYVSCNPATLARDLTIFLKQGYEVRHVTPFDFFPHTGHVEALASLVRNP